MANVGDVTGDLDDRVSVRLGPLAPGGDAFDAPILESYEVTRSLLTQPTTFSARFGWGDVARDCPTLGCDASLDWMDDLEPGHDPCYSHVFLYRGYDLTAAGIWEHDIAPCLLCAPLPPDRPPRS